MASHGIGEPGVVQRRDREGTTLIIMMDGSMLRRVAFVCQVGGVPLSSDRRSCSAGLLKFQTSIYSPHFRSHRQRAQPRRLSVSPSSHPSSLFAAMADSDSSSLSSAPSTDDEEMALKMMKPTGLDRYFKPVPKSESTPEPPKRAPSPPHEYTLADNEAIPFLVMLRSRFHDAFPKSLPHYGPQDIERGVSGELPDDQVERLLCNLLGLVLNRKKDVESVSLSTCGNAPATRDCQRLTILFAGEDTTDERWKKLLRVIRINGRLHGRA